MGLFDKFKSKKATVALAPETPASPAEPKELSQLKDGILILHWAALADHVQQEEEYNIIRNYARERIAAAGPKNADVEKLIAWAKPLRPSQDQVREAAQHVAAEAAHVQLVRAYAQTLVKSDDDVHAGELEAMRLIAKFFAEAEALRR